MSQFCIRLFTNIQSALQGEGNLQIAGAYGEECDEYFSNVLINGLYKYRMSPLIAPLGISPGARTRHLSFVCRPPTAVVDGRSQIAFCALLGNRCLDIPPEFIHPRYVGVLVLSISGIYIFGCISSLETTPVTHDEPNWVADGASVMTPQAYLTFVTRGMCQLVAGIVQQMPEHLDVQFDANTFLECITMRHPDNNQRIGPRTWPEGFGAATIGDSRRIQLVDRYESRSLMYESGIPDEKGMSSYLCMLLYADSRL